MRIKPGSIIQDITGICLLLDESAFLNVCQGSGNFGILVFYGRLTTCSIEEMRVMFAVVGKI